HDIVPDSRIVYTYEMTMNGQRISVSLATVSFTVEADGTHLMIREDGAFLDGLDTVQQREAGTNYLMDQLSAWLDRG
uniref:SRPBCC domain-containing protein n=1 Tax=Devosia sp. TaxID=1871048 RepID=UPI0035B3673A